MWTASGLLLEAEQGMLAGRFVKLCANDKLSVIIISITGNLLSIEVGIDGDIEGATKIQPKISKCEGIRSDIEEMNHGVPCSS